MYRRLALQGEYAILRLYASSVGRQNTQNLRQLLTLIAQHMAATKILCVHGIGHAEEDPRWNQPWDEIITDAFKRCNNPEPPQFAVVAYDDLFKDAPLNPAEYFEAVAELLASAAWHSIAGPSAARAFGPPDLGMYASRWFAGMVVQWVVDANLREKCRAAISAKIDQFQPGIRGCEFFGSRHGFTGWPFPHCSRRQSWLSGSSGYI
jgi:hypothetical protein